tara:strand:+ start:111 stop:875 length:765 start_codon:yes stop_codon:yes gene_type:complete
MKKLIILITVLTIISCTKEVDSPALLNQVTTLQAQIATLNSQVAEGSTLQATLNSSLNTKTAELETALSNYNSSQASLLELTTSYNDLYEAYDEIWFTVQLWFKRAEGDYETYFTNSAGERTASYVWSIGLNLASDGLTSNGTPYFDEYYWTGSCYSLNTDASLIEDNSKTFIMEASIDDFALISYDVPASYFGIFDIATNYTKINTIYRFTTVTGGLRDKLFYYDTDFNLIGTVTNYANTLPLPSSTITDYCN